MAKTSQREKIAYAKTLHKAGTTRVADIQKGVKEKFGTGLNFRDLGKVFPKKRGAKKKAKKRGPGRPPKAATPRRRPGRPKSSARRGRPAGWSSDQWLLMAGNEGETIGSKTKLQTRVAQLMGEGMAPSEITVYEKTSMKLAVKTTITL